MTKLPPNAALEPTQFDTFSLSGSHRGSSWVTGPAWLSFGPFGSSTGVMKPLGSYVRQSPRTAAALVDGSVPGAVTHAAWVPAAE